GPRGTRRASRGGPERGDSAGRAVSLRAPRALLPCAACVGQRTDAAADDRGGAFLWLRSRSRPPSRRRARACGRKWRRSSARACGAFLPASNQKRLVVAGAVAGLGAEHEFVTRFAVHRGAVVVAACRDPNWTTGGAHDPVAIMAAVAARLQAHGIAAVRDVVL